MNPHNFKLEKAPLYILDLEYHIPLFILVAEIAFLIHFHIALQKTQQPRCRNLSTEM